MKWQSFAEEAGVESTKRVYAHVEGTLEEAVARHTGKSWKDKHMTKRAPAPPQWTIARHYSLR